MASARLVRELVYEFPLVHILIGVFGNITFVLGSILFFYPEFEKPGLWMFIIGSTAMLIGSLGEAFVRYGRHKIGVRTGTES